MQEKHLHTHSWSEYELLDSGTLQKLERFGEVILARPETQALWEKKNSAAWDGAHATFQFKDGKGLWENTSAPHEWQIQWQDMVLQLELTNFKHIGVFPEQAPNWEWIQSEVKKRNAPKVLNLFGYTGAASIVAAHSGAKVTHVDASKTTLTWANHNRELSGLPEDAIRWICDDAYVFAKREAKRGNVYEGILLDPPAFGRGAKNEVWHIESDLPLLMKELSKMLAPGGFLLLNGYAAGYTPLSFAQLVQFHFPRTQLTYGELRLNEVRMLSQGIYVHAV